MIHKLPIVPLAILAGAVLWGGWLWSVASGTGSLDRAGQLIGTDFVMSYGAGYSFTEGLQSKLYDFSFQKELQQKLTGTSFTGSYNFYMPPIAALMYAPFASFSYLTAFVLWTILGIVLAWHGLRLLGYPFPLPHFILSLTFFPMFAAVSYGQNSLLSFFLLSAVYCLWMNKKWFYAGLVASVLLYKPQLLLGLLVLYLVRNDWKVLLGIVSGSMVAALLCIVLMPDATVNYLSLVQSRFGALTTESSFPITKQLSPYAFFFLLTGKSVLASKVLAALTAGLGLVIFIVFCRRVSPAEQFSGAVLLTFWLSPHLMIYDAMLLLIPAVIAWREALRDPTVLRMYYVLIWVALFVSVGAVSSQLQLSNYAILLGPLVIMFVSVHFWIKRRKFEG